MVFAWLVGMSAWTGPATDVADDFSADKWSDWKAADAVATFAHNPHVGRKAKGALQITIGPDNPRKAGLCFVRHFAVRPGRTYTALVYVRAGGLAPDSEITLAFQGQDANKQFLGTGVQSTILKGEQAPTDEWQRMVLSLRILETGRWEKAAILLCTLGVANAASGQVFFDDFEFFQVEE
jgi:hypothetical protein